MTTHALRTLIGINLCALVALTGCSGDGTSSEPAVDAATDSGSSDTGEALDTAPSDTGASDATDTAPSGLPFTASNNVGDVELTGIGDLVVDKDRCGNTIHQTKGQIQCDGPDKGIHRFFEQKQADGSTIHVYVVKSLRIDAGQTLRVRGDAPVAIVALGDLVINGQLLASANMGAAGPGGYATVSDGSASGPSGGAYELAKKGAGAGGCDKGGASGGGAVGGAALTMTKLVPLHGGSSGGGLSGGGGGGALQLVAGGKLQIGAMGVVHVGGGGAGPGSGGGAGGAVLIEATEATIEGTIAANGGGGGSGTGGGSGHNATTTSEPALGGAATGTPPVGGGNGGAGASAAGKDGSAHPSLTFHGGGGGSAGLIRVHTATGAASLSSLVTPSKDGACVVLDKVTPR